MLALIGGLLTSIVGGVKDHLEDKRAERRAESQNRQRLLLDAQSHNNEWEMASLRKSDRWLRRVCFFIFVWPMTPVLVWKPELVTEYFNSLNSLPDWYVQLVMAMIGGIWGIAELKNSLPALVNQFKK